MKTVSVYSKLGMDVNPKGWEKVAVWVLLALATLSFAAIAVAYVYSVVSGASGDNIPFV
jgi:hypothetical protein